MDAQTQPPGGGILMGLTDSNVTRGTIVRWSDKADWTTREGQPVKGPVLVIGFTIVLRRWKDGRPSYKTTYPLPNPKELNQAIPIEEWEPGLDGKPQPPWKYCYVFYFVNLTTGALYTFAHDTFGTLLCYQALEEGCLVQRMLRGPNVMPIAQLEKRPWKSATFGLQIRPHFEPIDWRELPGVAGGGNLVQPASTLQLSGPAPAPAPTAKEPPPWETPDSASASIYPPKASSAAAAAAKAAAAQSPLFAKTKPAAKPMTVAEQIADELPAHSAPPKTDNSWR
jgi:hypothetical protein